MITNKELYLESPLEQVRNFTKAMGQALDQPYEAGSALDLFRFSLVREETEEVSDAMEAEHLLKELADLQFVINGYAATFGWDLDEAFRRVYISNMSKLGDDGKPIYRQDGKVLKGPNYKEPDLSDLV